MALVGTRRWLALCAVVGLTPDIQACKTLQGFALANTAAAAPTPAVPALAQSQALLIFGGQGNSVFLGCLNCSEVDAQSVLNPVGNYGSPVSSTSIRNPVSDYGSTVSAYSACNPVALSAPVIVDAQGTFYGRLTMNTAAFDRTQNETIRSWLASVCARA